MKKAFLVRWERLAIWYNNLLSHLGGELLLLLLILNCTI